MNNKGAISLLSVLISSSMLWLGVTAFEYASANLQRHRQEIRETLVAEAYASELLELFTTFSSTEMLGYMSENPTYSTTGFTPYPLCSHINIEDRENSQMLNVDSLASLPIEISPFSTINQHKPNRFYQVQVTNLDTMELRSELCGSTAIELLTDPTKALGPRERLLVTVGVSWFPRSKLPTGFQRRVVLTTLLARR